MDCQCSCCSPQNNANQNNELKSHWDKTYTKETTQLGWYEENPEPSLRLIEKCKLSKNASMLHVGTGASTLIDELLKQNYQNIIANDLISSALDKLKVRLGPESAKINWIVDDLLHPTELNHIEQVDLWHDRAVLHFFSLEDQDRYFNLVKKLVKTEGYVIIAAFNLNSAEKCSGLPVYRFNETMLQCGLGEDFELIDSFNYTYTQPSGNTREYVYTLFKRK